MTEQEFINTADQVETIDAIEFIKDIYSNRGAGLEKNMSRQEILISIPSVLNAFSEANGASRFDELDNDARLRAVANNYVSFCVLAQLCKEESGTYELILLMPQFITLGSIKANYGDDVYNLALASPDKFIGYMEDSMLMANTWNDSLNDYIHDCVKLRQFMRDGKSSRVEIETKFLKRFKTIRESVRQSLRMLESMKSNCRSRKDIEKWFSRYWLAGPLKLAKEGRIAGLQHVQCDDETLTREFITCAKECGISCTPEQVDLDAIRAGIKQYCSITTGWDSPQGYLLWIKSDMLSQIWELDRLKHSTKTQTE